MMVYKVSCTFWIYMVHKIAQRNIPKPHAEFCSLLFILQQWNPLNPEHYVHEVEVKMRMLVC